MPPHALPGTSLLLDMPQGLGPFLKVPWPFIVLSLFQGTCLESFLPLQMQANFSRVARTTAKHFVWY